MATYKSRFEAFGWNVYVIDGHDIEKILNAISKAKSVKNKPTVLIGKTFKGRNFGVGVEDNVILYIIVISFIFLPNFIRCIIMVNL